MDKDRKWLVWCQLGAEIFSTCEKQQYMSIIVTKEGIVEATGYNGSPKGMDHCVDNCPRLKNKVPSGTPYDFGDGLCYSVHSEINCLTHSDPIKRVDGTMYINGVPCFNCAKVIANSGLARLVYKQEKFYREGSKEVFDLLDKTKIEIKGISF